MVGCKQLKAQEGGTAQQWQDPKVQHSKRVPVSYQVPTTDNKDDRVDKAHNAFSGNGWQVSQLLKSHTPDPVQAQKLFEAMPDEAGATALFSYYGMLQYWWLLVT